MAHSVHSTLAVAMWHRSHIGVRKASGWMVAFVDDAAEVESSGSSGEGVLRGLGLSGLCGARGSTGLVGAEKSVSKVCADEAGIVELA